jgi:hypothetical protein
MKVQWTEISLISERLTGLYRILPLQLGELGLFLLLWHTRQTEGWESQHPKMHKTQLLQRLKNFEQKK